MALPRDPGYVSPLALRGPSSSPLRPGAIMRRAEDGSVVPASYYNRTAKPGLRSPGGIRVTGALPNMDALAAAYGRKLTRAASQVRSQGRRAAG